MKLKKVLAMILTAAMITASLTACQNSEPKAQSNAPETKAQQTQKDTAAPDTQGEDASTSEETAGSQDQSGYNVSWEDMAEIKVAYCSMGPVPSGLQAVEDAVNEITEEEINTHVTLNLMEIGNYEQQINLMMSSGEQLDLMITLPGGPASFSTMSSQNQLIDITEVLDEYAPSVVDGIGDFMKGTQIDGKTYGATSYKSFVSGIYIIMRTDVLDDLGLLEKAQKMTSFKEYEEILEAVKNSDKWNYLSGLAASDGHGNILPIQNANLNAYDFADCGYFDNLGDTLFIVSADATGSDKTVKLNFETEEFRKMYEITRDWYEKGYINKDSATATEMSTELVKSNTLFSYVNQMEIGSEASASINSGMDMTCVKVLDLPVSTGSITKFVWVIPTIAKEPEAAATFLEMMYKDNRIANLFSWGIENVDYEVGEDGVAHYIAGNENPAYHNVDFLAVNKFIVLPWEGNDPKIRENEKAIMDNAILTPFLGFTCDTTAITNELSAITNVINEYRAQITSGVADEQTYQAFIDKLHTSGVDKIVEAYQTQLDAWLQN